MVANITSTSAAIVNNKAKDAVTVTQSERCLQALDYPSGQTAVNLCGVTTSSKKSKKGRPFDGTWKDGLKVKLLICV